jgi:hypothetical protein
MQANKGHGENVNRIVSRGEWPLYVPPSRATKTPANSVRATAERLRLENGLDVSIWDIPVANIGRKLDPSIFHSLIGILRRRLGLSRHGTPFSSKPHIESGPIFSPDRQNTDNATHTELHNFFEIRIC